jgi:hypothetical protein
MTKEENYEIMQKALHSCTEEGAERVAVVVMVDNKTKSVKVYGLNVDGSDVPQFLMNVAEEMYEQHTHQLMNRMLN